MADSLLAALVYGVPLRERGGTQIPLPTNGKELQEILNTKGWVFRPDASQFANSAIIVRLNDTLIAHAEDQPHFDQVHVTSEANAKETLYVKCQKKPFLEGEIVIATKQRS